MRCLWDSSRWINDCEPAAEEAILASAGEVTAPPEPFPVVLENRVFSFLRVFKIQPVFMKYAGTMLSASDN